MSTPRLLIVDDEPAVLEIVERFAEQLGFESVCHRSGSEALAALPELKPDVVLVDLQMPQLTGIDVLRAVRAAHPECQVILMTGNATVDTAVEAVKAGALDYLSKPLDFDRLGVLLETVRERISRREQLLKSDTDLAARFEFHGMTGRGPAMQELFDSIRRFAPHARTVLITGETGTGKELVARALHKVGPRRDRRLVTLNCSAVVPTLFESELFGHVRGAFTGASETKIGLFEHAGGGTLFLDEAGELPLSLQPKLLRAIEYGEVQRVGAIETRRSDVHVIAATNRDLHLEVAAGRFRADLYYRLAIIEIRLVPLRERREDIPYLTATFVKQCSQRLQRSITGVSPAAEQLLRQAPWPGNIRELRNVIERACIMCDGRTLTERDLAIGMTTADQRGVPHSQPASQNPHSTRATAVSAEEIARVMAEVGGNKAAAAKLLGMSRQALYRWLDRLEREQRARPEDDAPTSR